MYKFTIPQNVIFGINALEKIGAAVPQNVKTLIVSGRSAVKNGIFSLSELMYNAGTRAAALIAERYDVLCKKAVIVCGNGNGNGHK